MRIAIITTYPIQKPKRTTPQWAEETRQWIRENEWQEMEHIREKANNYNKNRKPRRKNSSTNQTNTVKKTKIRMETSCTIPKTTGKTTRTEKITKTNNKTPQDIINNHEVTYGENPISISRPPHQKTTHTHARRNT